MFPGAGSHVYYNEEGEPLGWDAAYEDEYDYDDGQVYDYDDQDVDDDE